MIAGVRVIDDYAYLTEVAATPRAATGRRMCRAQPHPYSHPDLTGSSEPSGAADRGRH